ncbi:MAG: adenylate kinase [Bacteroidales bacterium]|nr:adenylate kinase [Bacteroidales bacterium]
MKNIILFGAPGAGKGTQSAIIREKFAFAYISTGEILRSEIKKQTELGKQAEEIINKGQLVSDEIIVGMIQSFIELHPNEDLLLDGFPRTEQQARALDGILASQNRGNATVIELKVDKEVLMQRLLKRAEIEGRKDDNETTIKERFAQYEAKTAAVADYYKAKNAYVELDGEHGTPEQISVLLCKTIENL